MASGVARRHATGNSLCPLCKQVEETLEHFLYECGELKAERRMAETRTRYLIVSFMSCTSR